MSLSTTLIRSHKLRSSLFAGLLIVGATLTSADGRTTVAAPAPAAPAVAAVTAPMPATMTNDLQSQFLNAPTGSKLEYWVILKEQADTRNTIPNTQWADKGWYVYNALKNAAERTQPAVLQTINSLVATDQISSVHSFWIINSFVLTGDYASAQALAAHPAVAKVRAPGKYEIFDAPQEISPAALAAVGRLSNAPTGAGPLAALAALAPDVPLTVQHNLNEVHAPQAWALGYTGSGITVGQMDTGVRWTHENVNARYRGVVAPPDPGNIHDYNWLDGYSTFTVPTDNNGHGTHTMGTIVGTSPNPTYGNTGTAPGAQWMAVRICATSSCDLTPIMNGFQWILAPTRVNGTQARPDLRPRISSNSWGNSTCNDAEFQTGVTNWVNAGIFPDFATGNSGPGAGSVGVPAAYPNSWGTGNLDTSTSNWTINSSSSRGPSCWDNSIRPQAIAPGTSICSSVNGSDTSYSCSYTGTSMATPHIAGALAVLLSKNTNETIPQLMYAITSTAFFSPTWGTRPNNNYGWGAAANGCRAGRNPRTRHGHADGDRHLADRHPHQYRDANAASLRNSNGDGDDGSLLGLRDHHR